MFEEYIDPKLSSIDRIKQNPFNLPSVSISAIVHLFAILVLIAHPEIAFPVKIYPVKARSKIPSASKVLTVITYVDQPKSFVEPVKRSEEALYSDQNRLAKSNPPRRVRNGNKLPYSKGRPKRPAPISILARKEPPAERNENNRGESSQDSQRSVDSINQNKIKSPTTSERLPENSFVLPSPQPPRTETASAGPAPNSQSQPKIFENEESARKSVGSGLFNTKDFPLSDYWREVVRRIKENWIVPQQALYSRGRSILIFYIEKDGRVSGLKLINTSGNPSLDMSALHSVIASNPFPPLPQGFPGENLGAKFALSYNEEN